MIDLRGGDQPSRIPPTLRARPSRRALSFLEATMTDWYARCAYDPLAKRRFHAAARARLRCLATAHGFAPASFDLRSNRGGIAVSGEITLHHEHVYVQVCQPATGADSGILIRTCKGRRDYTGGPNNFAPLRLLDDIPALAERVRAVMPRDETGFEPRERQRRTGSGASRIGPRESPPAVPQPASGDQS
jgi:hypothetical protein